MAAETGTVTTPDGKKINKVEALKLAKDGVDVWDDIFRYGKAEVAPLDATLADAFLKSGGTEGELVSAARQAAIPEEDFVRMRWYGIYQQLPNNGYFMLRIRIPNGFLTPAQLQEIAALSTQYSGAGLGISRRGSAFSCIG